MNVSLTAEKWSAILSILQHQSYYIVADLIEDIEEQLEMGNYPIDLSKRVIVNKQ